MSPVSFELKTTTPQRTDRRWETLRGDVCFRLKAGTRGAGGLGMTCHGKHNTDE